MWRSAKSVVRVIGGGAPAAALSVRGRGPEAEVGEMRVGEGGAPTDAREEASAEIVGAIGVGETAAAHGVGRKKVLEAEVGETRVGEGGAPTAQGPPRDNGGKGKGGAAQVEAELRSAPEDPQLRSAPPWSAADAATL